jgi:hypothetical protein
MVPHTAKGVGDRTATIGHGPGSVYMAEMTRIPIIMAIAVVPGIAKKEIK